MAKTPLITPAFLALTGAELAYFIAVGALIPVVPLFAANRLGAGPVGVGVAVGAFSVTALVLRPIAGRLSDRWGSGRLFLIGGLLFAVTAGAHVFVTSYWTLLGLRVVLGVAEALFFVAGMAALADIAPPERLGEALSYNSLGLYLGIAFGPSVGEWLVSVGGFRAAWLGTLCLGVIAALLALLIPANRKPAQEQRRGPLLPRQLLGPGFAFLAGLAGAGGFLAFAALYARDLGLSGAGAVLFTYGVTVVVCRVLFARLSDRHPARAMSTLALVGCAAGLLTIFVVRVPAGLFAGAAILALGITFLTPAFFREMMARLPAAQRGSAAAAFSIFVDLGLGGGPILFGLIVRAASIPAAFATSAGFALLAAAAVATKTASRSGATDR